MAESPRPEVTRLEFAVQQDVTHYLSLPGKELRLTQRLTTIRGAFPEAGPDANQRMRQFFEKHVAIAPDVDTATMASGNMLLKNPRFLYRLQADGHGRIKIGEMEASGLVTACREHNTPWFVIRGVSDLGDERKSDKFHKFAAQMAAIVTRDFIECGLDLQIQRARAPGRLITAKTPTAPSLPEISKAISRLSQNPLADARPSGPVLKKYFDMSTVFRGTVFRLVRAPFVPTSAVSWSARTPWAEDGSVIFFALTPKTALSELGPEVNVLQSKFQIVQFYVNLSHVLRLSDAIVQTRLNIDSAHLLSNVTYAKCVRDTARIARCEGLIVQSKWDPRGYLLIVFDRIRPDSTVSFVATLVCED
jgi:hypothetical protein